MLIHNTYFKCIIEYPTSLASSTKPEYIFWILFFPLCVCAPFCCSHCCSFCCCGFDLCARLIVVKKWKSTAAATTITTTTTKTKGKINPAKAAAVKWWAAEEVAVGRWGGVSRNRPQPRRKCQREIDWERREREENLLARLCGRLMWLPSWLNFIFVACMPGFGDCAARVQPDDLHSIEKRRIRGNRGGIEEWNGWCSEHNWAAIIWPFLHIFVQFCSLMVSRWRRQRPQCSQWYTY